METVGADTCEGPVCLEKMAIGSGQKCRTSQQERAGGVERPKEKRNGKQISGGFLEGGGEDRKWNAHIQKLVFPRATYKAQLIGKVDWKVIVRSERR